MFLDRIIAALRRATGLSPRALSAPEALERDADGAVVFRESAEIAASPETVFRLLDIAGHDHRWSRRGDKVEAIDAGRGLYRLTDKRLPDAPFIVQVTESVQNAVIATVTVGDGGAPIGAVSKSVSRYEIAPAPGGAAATLVERAHFLAGLPEKQLRQHAHMMASGVRIDLFRLKEEAEKADAQAMRAKG